MTLNGVSLTLAPQVLAAKCCVLPMQYQLLCTLFQDKCSPESAVHFRERCAATSICVQGIVLQSRKRRISL